MHQPTSTKEGSPIDSNSTVLRQGKLALYQHVKSQAHFCSVDDWFYAWLTADGSE